MLRMKKEVTFGLVVGTRGFFNPDLAAKGRELLLQRMRQLGYRCVIPPAEMTTAGAVETRADARKFAHAFSSKRDEIDGIIISLPNFGDELAVIQTLEMAGLNVPVLVHAFDDELGKLDGAQRRDAFCGKISVCNNLYQYGIHFTDTSFHTCAVESDAFAADINRFARVCRVVGGLKGARIGAIGARPAAFQTVRASEKLLQASGITVVPTDLSEIFSAAEKLADESPDVKTKITEIRAYGKVAADVKPDSIARVARLSLVIERWLDENEIDAAAVQCWTSVQQNYGCCACASSSMLSEKLRPVACEVDIAGAVSMYALVLATGQPAALVDWNNNYGQDRDKCIAQHCSNYPKSFIGGEIEITHPWAISAKMGKDRCFGGISGKAVPGPFTYCRVSTDDRAGRIKAYVGEGEFTDEPCSMLGGIAICKIPGLQRLLKHMCARGFEHHGAMARTHVAEVVAEAFGKYMGWDVYQHQG